MSIKVVFPTNHQVSEVQVVHRTAMCIAYTVSQKITTLSCYNFCISEPIFQRAFVNRFVLYYRTVDLFFLSVALVYCGQTVGRIKMKLDMEVALGPGHIVLDGGPSSPPPNRAQPRPIFGPCLLWPNGWMDQDATWYGGRPRPRPHGVRWGSSFPLPRKRHSSPSPYFRPMSVVAKQSPISASAEQLL